MNYLEKLQAAQKKNDSWVCVGLDSDPARLPDAVKGDAAAFNAAIIEATADLVCAYKVNLGFYLAGGPAGMAALESTLTSIPADIPTIWDGKFGDIGSTAAAYARAAFEVWGFDAVTLNPYVGFDAVAPFLAYADRGVYVLARTSNRSGNDLQGIHTPQAPLYQVVVQQAAMWGAEARHEGRGAVGIVVGATHPDDLAKIRGWTPHLPFLIPGIGAQGGSIEAAAGYGAAADGTGPVINSSRGIIFASSGADFAETARSEAELLREAISSARQEAAS